MASASPYEASCAHCPGSHESPVKCALYILYAITTMLDNCSSLSLPLPPLSPCLCGIPIDSQHE